MYIESGQFGSFEGRDNRKTVYNLFVRLGDGLSVEEAARRRARFLQALIRYSDNGFARRMCQVSPCTAPEAYFLFVAITGCLGVDINLAAQKLEHLVRKGPSSAAPTLTERSKLGLAAPRLIQGGGMP